MKYFSLLAMLAVVTPCLLVACNDDDNSSVVNPDVTPDEKTLSITPSSVSTSKTGGVYTVNYETADADQVVTTVSADWVVAEVSASSDTTGVINITIAEYKVENTTTDYDPRSASITVHAGDITKEISISQSPVDLLEPDESSKINSILQEYNINYEGLTSYKVTFNTNGEFSVSSPWWIYLKDTPVKKLVEGTTSQYEVEADIVVLANYADESRIDSISFDLGEAHFACKFNQEKTGWDFTGVDRSALEIAQDMKLGWNMLDAYKTDASIAANTSALSDWMVDSVATYNVNVVRFPVLAYDTVAKTPNSYWINGVNSMAQAIAAKGKYAVISLADNGWILRSIQNSDTTEFFNLFVNTWREIATLFDENDDHILFESYDDYSLSELGESASPIMKRLNELFVQTIRRSGKNNYKRCLIIPFDAQSGETVSMPTNEVVEGRLFTSCKFFKPEEFVYADGGKKLWGAPFSSASEDWSSSFDEDAVNQYFSDIYAKLNREAHNVPAILSAFGTVSHSSEAIYGSSEGYYANQVALAAKANGFVPFVWDDADTSIGHFGIFNYANQNSFVARREYISALAQAAQGEKYDTGSDEEEGEE